MNYVDPRHRADIENIKLMLSRKEVTVEEAERQVLEAMQRARKRKGCNYRG